MKPLRKVHGRVAILDRPDVDTDQIIPKQFLKRIERTGYGEFLFNDWRFDEDGDERPVRAQPARVPGASILLAGRNFGCGSSREHAAWALQDYGIDAVVAPSFGDIFRTNAGKNGMLAIVLPPDEVERLMESVDLDSGSEMTVDLERRRRRARRPRGARSSSTRRLRHRILHGLDEIALTLQHEDEIAAYESGARHRVTRVAVLPGDGIGPEVTAEAIRVLDALGIEHTEHAFGGNAILAQGDAAPGRDARGVPRGRRRPARGRGAARARGPGRAPRAGLLGLRKELGVYANLRPAQADGIDLVIVRELSAASTSARRARATTAPGSTRASTRARRSSASRGAPSSSRGRGRGG